MCTMCTYVLFHYYCPLLYGEAPWWAYVLNALSILAYQGLDAMDGKVDGAVDDSLYEHRDLMGDKRWA